MTQHTYSYPLPAVTADNVVLWLAENASRGAILLIERKRDPYAGAWALPGGFLEVGVGYGPGPDQGESLESCAHRELEEETGLAPSPGSERGYIRQISAYGNPHRDPRGRVISIAFLQLRFGSAPPPVDGRDDAQKARWFAIQPSSGPKQAPVRIGRGELAFDHAQIIRDALDSLARQPEPWLSTAPAWANADKVLLDPRVD